MFKFWDVHGLDPYVPGARDVSYGGLLLLVLLTGLGALGLKRLSWPNAWVIGPLLVAIALTSQQVNLSALPEWMVRLGQLFIGISLGARFSPEFLHTAPRFLIGVAVCTIGAMTVAAGFGLGLASIGDMHRATAILATSPGGIAEMSLTAKTLQLGVPIVTAFHVMRLATLVLTIGPLYRLAMWLRKRRQSSYAS
jgi:membrane AbrB-like protein